LGPLGAMLDPIPTGAKHLLALVENAHRADDEYFLMVHAERCVHTRAFLTKAQGWQDTWNFFRSNYGLGMKGLTPREKLKATKVMMHQHVLLFPVLLLEGLLRKIGSLNHFLRQHEGGKYVHTTCQYLRYRPGLATKTQTRSRQPHQTVTRGFLHFAIDNCETFHYPFTGRRENRNNTVAER